jgi:hypothetical protein
MERTKRVRNAPRKFIAWAKIPLKFLFTVHLLFIIGEGIRLPSPEVQLTPFT